MGAAIRCAIAALCISLLAAPALAHNGPDFSLYRMSFLLRSYGCPASVAAPVKCEDGHTEECSLLQRADALPEKDQYGHLLSLLRKFRISGLVEAEQEVRHRLPAARETYVKREDYRGFLSQARNEIHSCAPEQALITLSDLESHPSTQNRGALEDHLAERAVAVLERARAGDKAGVRERIAQLRGEIAELKFVAQSGAYGVTDIAPNFPTRDEPWVQLHKLRITIAKAAAEVDDYDLALELLPARNGRTAGQIAQIAVRRGNVDRAIAMVENDSRPKSREEAWTEFFARAAAIQVLVERGRNAEAESWAARWNAIKVSEIEPALPRINVHRLIALELAKREPLAAFMYLKEQAPNSCVNGLAIVAARSGLPSEAEQIIDSDAPGKIQIKGDPQDTRDAAWVSFAAASVDTAAAYRRAGDESKASAVINRAMSAFNANADQILPSNAARHTDGFVERIARELAGYGSLPLVEDFVREMFNRLPALETEVQLKSRSDELTALMKKLPRFMKEMASPKYSSATEPFEWLYFVPGTVALGKALDDCPVTDWPTRQNEYRWTSIPTVPPQTPPRPQPRPPTHQQGLY